MLSRTSMLTLAAAALLVLGLTAGLAFTRGGRPLTAISPVPRATVASTPAATAPTSREILPCGHEILDEIRTGQQRTVHCVKGHEWIYAQDRWFPGFSNLDYFPAYDRNPGAAIATTNPEAAPKDEILPCGHKLQTSMGIGEGRMAWCQEKHGWVLHAGKWEPYKPGLGF